MFCIIWIYIKAINKITFGYISRIVAVYLCKRTMQNKTRLELADYEAENLAKLQKMFSRKWEFIFMQAEAQSKVDKKRDKLERKVLDSQERAFWDVHRPMVKDFIKYFLLFFLFFFSFEERVSLCLFRGMKRKKRKNLWHRPNDVFLIYLTNPITTTTTTTTDYSLGV